MDYSREIYTGTTRLDDADAERRFLRSLAHAALFAGGVIRERSIQVAITTHDDFRRERFTAIPSLSRAR